MEPRCIMRCNLVALVMVLTIAVSGCTVPMGTLHPGPLGQVDGLTIPAKDAVALYRVRGEWMRLDFDADMDYARLIRRREVNLYVRLRWCSNGVPGREITIARLFGEGGRVTNASRLRPVSGSPPKNLLVFRYHTYVPVRVPKGPVMPPGSPEQGGDYDLRHPADDLCMSVAGGDMAGNYGESTILVYPADAVSGAAR
jgi:hypothetical protein